MTFLHVALLGGAAFVAVPIILHLVMRQQPRHLEFPALRFIRQRESANRRRLRLRHLLLLLCRCAILALLALALARPSIRASGMIGDQEAPVAAVLVFDTSPRMDYRQQNKSRLQVAEETALWLLPQLPADSEIAVLDAHSGLGAFAVDSAAAKARIEHLDTSAVAQPLANACDHAARLLAESEKQRKEIYIMSDFSRSSWAATSAQALQQRLKQLPGVGIYVVDVGAKDPQNFGLAQVRLSGQSLTKNRPLTVQCEVLHTGPEAERTVELYLLDAQGEASKRGQASVRFRADESQQVEFRVGGLAPGVHQGFLKLLGEDGLACDDKAYFSVEVRPAWRVLLAAPAKPADYALFLSEALAPDNFRAKGEAAFDCEILALDELTKRPLDGYAAVCLLDPKPLSAEAWQQLAGYASSGGGVAIFLGRNAQPVESFNEAAAQELLPGKLLRQWRAGDDPIYLTPDSLEHPVLAKFKSLESAIPWEALPVFRFWQLGPLQKSAAVVASYSNNYAAIVEKAVGKGRVLTMTTPVSDPANRADTWNILPTSEEYWPFVMLSNEMLYYLVGSGESRLNYIAGQSAVLQLTGQPHSMFSITTPRGDQIRQSIDEKQNLLVIAATDLAGNYQVRAGGDVDRVERGFSVNLPKGVSQFDRASEDDLKAVFGDAEYQVAHNREEINRKVSLGRVGRELYPFLLVLLVLVLTAEQILSNRFYGKDPQGPRGPAVLEKSPSRGAVRANDEAAAVVAR